MPLLRVLDSLTVDVLSDNLTDSYSTKPSFVTPEFNNVVDAGASELSGATLCCAQLGLSLMLTAQAGSARRKLIFDAGPEGSVVLRNCRNLGADLHDVDVVAISHGHWDHMGALTAVLDEVSVGGHTVSCHVNAGMFVERGARLSDGRIVPFEKVPSPGELATHGVEVVNDPAERTLADGTFYLSGEIPRVTSFETGRQDHLCRKGEDHEWRPDPLLMDERYLAVNLRDQGIVAFSACSHAGVINVLEDVRATFPELPIYAVFGGLHLVGSLETIISETVQHLKRFRLRYIVPAHCSGFRAVHALLNAFGEDIVVPCAVGSRYAF